MARTLITGMSATGKSTTVAELRRRGHRAVDLDTDAWSHWVPDESGLAAAAGELDWRWRADAVRALLEDHRDVVVSGTSTNQGEVYDLLDHVVLLTVPEAVAVVRLAIRTTNDYGKHPSELRRELELREAVEPLLRAGACLVLDTASLGPAQVAAAVLAHVAEGHQALPHDARH